MGAALMRNRENAFNIMKALVDKFGHQISVSCKIRVLRNYEDTLKYILAMQEAGVHWITIHPRTAAEETRVPARWYTVKSFLDTGLIKIPLLGSGDLFSPLDVHKYLTSTGAHGVILARGAIHNPGIFQLKSQMLDRT
jgi:tRNA-dihydrouridine synthase